MTKESGIIRLADGFIEGGNILSSDQFANADFTAPDYQVARIRVLNAITGNNTSEKLRGTKADDYIAGESGNDHLRGLRGNDILNGGQGRDYLFGGRGHDELNGDEGRDYLFGGKGHDVLNGGKGRDFLHGGRGHDTLAGEEGRNILRGGAGNDIFVLNSNGTAIIQDFSTNDRIQIGAGLQFTDLSIDQRGHNALISTDNDTLAVLRNVDVTSIDDSVFI